MRCNQITIIDATDGALRMLAGVEGAFSLNNRRDFNAHLGHLAGNSGTDSAATVTNGVFTGVGTQYAATDRLSFGTSIGYLNTKMDAPQNVVELWTLELRADNDIDAISSMPPFAAAQYGESHQKEIIGPDETSPTQLL